MRFLSVALAFLFAHTLIFSANSHDNASNNSKQTHPLETYSSRKLADDISSASPDWSISFLTPFNVHITSDNVEVQMCQMNFKSYSAAPHFHPMFKDLVSLSDCRKGNTKVVDLEAALTQQPESPNIVSYPTGFVFHESRVGSTLVANLLGSDPWSMMFSESTPPSSVLNHCKGCSRARKVQMFRDVITLMSRSPIHERAFFKFNSITVSKMDIVLEAFPDVPWVFVYRNPVQTMMSHLDPSKFKASANGSRKGSPPCLRSQKDRQPHAEIVSALNSALGTAVSPKQAPPEAWCAAHLNMLCTKALDNFHINGVYSTPALTSSSVASTASKHRLLRSVSSYSDMISSESGSVNSSIPTHKSDKRTSSSIDTSSGAVIRRSLRVFSVLEGIFNGNSKDSGSSSTASLGHTKGSGVLMDFSQRITGQRRALLINYESLPGAIPQAILPLFGIPKPSSTWASRMKEEAQFYSKSRLPGVRQQSKAGVFQGDSESKEKRSTPAIQRFSGEILMPTYHALNQHALDALKQIVPVIYKQVAPNGSPTTDLTVSSEAPPSSGSASSSSSPVRVHAAVSVSYGHKLADETHHHQEKKAMPSVEWRKISSIPQYQ